MTNKTVVKQHKVIKDCMGLGKKYVFTPLDFRAVAINIYSGLINNLLKVGRVTYLKEEQLDKMLFLGGKDAVPEHFHQNARRRPKFRR